MFAQAFHPAMKYAAPTRREIGVRTAFNILGPLTNPAGAEHQVLGVALPNLAPLMAGVLERLGSKHVIVVHGHDGSDELTLDGTCPVYQLNGEGVKEYEVEARRFGLTTALASAIKGGTPEDNARTLRELLSGEQGPIRDVVLFNSAAALMAADLATDFKEGIAQAAESIDSGRASERMESFVAVSQSAGMG
jgi:anthranilate phosphoribosyltransferase